MLPRSRDLFASASAYLLSFDRETLLFRAACSAAAIFGLVGSQFNPVFPAIASLTLAFALASSTLRFLAEVCVDEEGVPIICTCLRRRYVPLRDDDGRNSPDGEGIDGGGGSGRSARAAATARAAEAQTLALTLFALRAQAAGDPNAGALLRAAADIAAGRSPRDWESLLAIGDAVGAGSGAGLSSSELVSLPTFVWSGKSGGGVGADESCESGGTDIDVNAKGAAGGCAICLEGFRVGDAVRPMPCCHLFHAGCVDQWLKIKAVCPDCRTTVRHGTAGRSGETV